MRKYIYTHIHWLLFFMLVLLSVFALLFSGWKEFLENWFGGLATLFSAWFLILVYFLQKLDNKIKSARVLLMEIRKAESACNEIKKTKVINDFVTTILPVNSWTKYKHEFVKDLDEDELKSIDNFYTICSALEVSLKNIRNYTPLAIEEKVKIIQLKLLDLQSKVDDNKYQEEKRKILDRFEKEDYCFFANREKMNIFEWIICLHDISTSTGIKKLKKLANEE